MTFKQFKKEYETLLKTKPQFIRKGQVLMNYLGDVWIEEYKRITDKQEVDCFHRDVLIPKTLQHLESVWGEKNQKQKIICNKKT